MGKRGRPKGSGKRWSEFQEYTLWARLKLIIETEHKGVVDACQALEGRGYFQSADGKYWASNPDLSIDPRLPPLVENLRPGDKRDECPWQQFYARYFAAERKRKKDPAFRAECDFWLSVYRRARELKETGVKPDEAGLQAFEEQFRSPD